MKILVLQLCCPPGRRWLLVCPPAPRLAMPLPGLPQPNKAPTTTAPGNIPGPTPHSLPPWHITTWLSTPWLGYPTVGLMSKANGNVNKDPIAVSAVKLLAPNPRYIPMPRPPAAGSDHHEGLHHSFSSSFIGPSSSERLPLQQLLMVMQLKF